MTHIIRYLCQQARILLIISTLYLNALNAPSGYIFDSAIVNV